MATEYKVKTAHLFCRDTVADSSALLFPLMVVPAKIKITAFRVGASAAITAADTNYNTINLKNGSNIVSGIATGPVAGGISIAAGAFASGTLVAAYTEFAAADVMTLAIAKTGTGMAYTGLVIQIDYLEYNV